MPYYLINYPMFGKRMIGMMGIPVPGEFDMSDERALNRRCHLYTYEVEVSGQSNTITLHAYSMSHALRMAANIQMFNDEVVTVRLEK